MNNVNVFFQGNAYFDLKSRMETISLLRFEVRQVRRSRGSVTPVNTILLRITTDIIQL